MEVLLTLLFLLIILGIISWYRYYRYRFVSFIRYGYTDDMGPFPLEGYTNKPFYFQGEEISFYIHSEFDNGNAQISLLGRSASSALAEFSFEQKQQVHVPSNAENGCNWERTAAIKLDERFAPGYYRCTLTSGSSSFDLYFIVGKRASSKTVIVAPVGTWTAYNCWGGRSHYQNQYENKTVYFVSTERPNTASPVKHNIIAEGNIFDWFSSEYNEVNVLPDYMLESNPELFDDCKLIVLAYHNEYISRGTYDNLLKLLRRKVPMISLGANQLYWSVRWNKNHTQMECHKDLTSFKDPNEYGGMWRHHLRLMERVFGVGYKGSGMHTFAPYRVNDASHWLYEGTGVKNGDLFGTNGISNRPISGAETDKITRFSGNVEKIAHGMNCETESQGTIYNGDEAIWNGAGGGDFVLKYHTSGSLILSTASIESGAGLGIDPVFTQIIRNFIKRAVKD